MDIIDSKLIELSNLVGVPDDQIKMLIGLLLSVSYGWIFKAFIRGRQQRMYAGAFFGVFLTFFVYGNQILNVFLQTVIVYLIVAVLKTKSPLPVFLETLFYVSVHHLYRQYHDYGGWRLDVTTILMMDTVKWTSFAMCVRDGLVDEKLLSKEQKERKIDKLPSFGEFFSYVFFFAGSMIGPAYDYKDWDVFVSEKEECKQIPSTFWEVLRLFKNGVLCLAIFMGLGPYFSLDFISSKEFGEWNFLKQTVWMNILIIIQRCKYYSGWQFGEMSIASCGLTYAEGGQFEKIKSIELDWELTYNMKDKVEKWNVSIQTWLRRYVYSRMYSEEEIRKSPAKQNIAYQTTYAVSSLWHGFYPGYYLSFFQWAILNNVNKAFYRASVNTSYFEIFETNILAKAVRWYVANTMFNFCGITFLLMSVQQILEYYSNMRWIPQILLFGTYGFFLATNFGQKRKTK